MTASPQRWTRWGVRLTLTAGVAASVTANILHARPNPISQAIAAWPPLALLVTVELVTRIPVFRKTLGVLRIAATSAIAAIAAWISYHHMVGVVARYGETGTVPYLLPLSVDGLIVVASISLIELSARPSSPPAPAPAAPATAEPSTARSAETPATLTPPAALPAPAATPPPPTAQAEPIAEPMDQPAAEPQSGLPSASVNGDSSQIDLPPDDQPKPPPDHDEDQDDEDRNDEDDNEEVDDGVDLAPDLAPLLPAARTARDELIREGRTVSRDALAQRLRRNGHPIRNNRVSELLNALRREEPSPNGTRPTVSA
jgi:hypothetical protein